MNVVRAISEEGFGRIKFNEKIYRQLQSEKEFRNYFERETTELPQFYVDFIKQDMGPLWEWLPEGAMFHEPNAYLENIEQRVAV